MAGQPKQLVDLIPEDNVRGIPLRYPSSWQLWQSGIGRARVWRAWVMRWCGSRHGGY